ncbi:transcriptional regulator, MarR family [Trichinella spiralis]|nr:transcriptional regulator, MarR family [Trichinella spiralis]
MTKNGGVMDAHANGRLLGLVLSIIYPHGRDSQQHKICLQDH